MAGGFDDDGVDCHDQTCRRSPVLQEQIQAAKQMRGRGGLRGLKAKAAKVGVRAVEKRGGRWTSLRLEV